MHRAVDGLMLECASPSRPSATRAAVRRCRDSFATTPLGLLHRYRLTFLFFTMGLIAFHVSALLFAWLEFSW